MKKKVYNLIIMSMVDHLNTYVIALRNIYYNLLAIDLNDPELYYIFRDDLI